MTWQVGDLAVCTPLFDVDVWADCFTGDDPVFGPLAGDILRVTWCGVDFDGVYSLSFAELQDERWDASEFRKIDPDKLEDCEPEFVTLLKRIKRTVPASAMSASGQDAQRLEAKPASAAPERGDAQ